MKHLLALAIRAFWPLPMQRLPTPKIPMIASRSVLAR